MNDPDTFGFGTQIRKSPYFQATVNWGAKAFSVYNHMYIPRDFGDPEQNYWNLVNDALVCDVAGERQVEITVPMQQVYANINCAISVRWLYCKYIYN